MQRKFWTVLAVTLIPLFCHAQERALKAGTEAETALKQRLVETKKRRLIELSVCMQKLGIATAVLKKAMIESDSKRIADEEANIRRIQDSIRQTIATPISDTPLTVSKLQAGQIGTLRSPRFKVMQIIDKPKGELLVRAHRVQIGSPNDVTLKISGADTNNLVDDSDFSQTDCLFVAGTYTYSTVAGSTKTIFELQICSP